MVFLGAVGQTMNYVFSGGKSYPEVIQSLKGDPSQTICDPEIFAHVDDAFNLSSCLLLPPLFLSSIFLHVYMRLRSTIIIMSMCLSLPCVIAFGRVCTSMYPLSAFSSSYVVSFPEFFECSVLYRRCNANR